MIAVIILLAVLCFVLLLILGGEDSKNADLVGENAALKKHLEAVEENYVSKSYVLAPLSIQEIAQAVRSVGFEPEINNDWVRFIVGNQPVFINCEHLPEIFIFSDFNVPASEWDLSLLKDASHLMSDNMIIAKAIIVNGEMGTVLRIFVSALDRNYPSFQPNLLPYLTMINDGQRKLVEIYHRLEDARMGMVDPNISLTSNTDHNNTPLS